MKRTAIRVMLAAGVILCGALGSFSGFAGEARLISSRIDSVKVYERGAQVHRVARLELKPGSNYFEIPGLPWDADMSSLRVSLQDSDYARLLDMTIREDVQRPEQDAAVQDLQAAVSRLTAAVSEKKDALLVLDKKLAFLNQVIEAVSHATGTLPATEKLEGVLSFVGSQNAGILEEKRRIEAEKKRLEEDLEMARKRLRQRTNSLENSEIHLVLHVIAASPVQTTADITYMMDDAGWSPTYRLSMDPSRKTADLAFRASVHQHTGEDWENIRLTLVTGRPRTMDAVPKLKPRLIEVMEVQGTGVTGMVRSEDGEALPGVEVQVYSGSRMVTATTTDETGRYALGGLSIPTCNLRFSLPGFLPKTVRDVKLVADRLVRIDTILRIATVQESIVVTAEQPVIEALKELEAAGPETTQLSVNQTYAVKERISLPSMEDSPRVFSISEMQLALESEYFCVPSSDLGAYLTARLTNQTDTLIRSGIAEMVYENEFVGVADFPVLGFQQSTRIPVTVDDAIAVTRAIRKKRHGTRGFTRKQQVDTREIEIRVQNNRNRPIRIRILENIPVSTDERVHVTLLHADPGVTPDANTGTLVWQLPVGAGELMTLSYAYEVSYPEALHVSWQEPSSDEN